MERGESGFKGVRQWLREFLTWRTRVVLESAHASLYTSGMARGRVRAGVGPDAGLEERIATLEKNQKLLEKEIDQERIENERKFIPD